VSGAENIHTAHRLTPDVEAARNVYLTFSQTKVRPCFSSDAHAASFSKGSIHMKRTLQSLVIAGSLVCGSAAFAQSTTAPMATAKAKAGAKGTVEHMGVIVPSDEKAYLERLHHANQQEIKLGQLAQQNAQNPEVKTFGSQMVQEHTTADEKLLTYAKGKNLKLADPKPINDVEKKVMAADKASAEKLQALKGAPFDSAYMSNQIGAHDMVLGKLAAGQQAFSGNAEALALINENVQHVAMHRQQAYTVLGKLAPQPTGVGGSGDAHMNHNMGTGANDMKGSNDMKGTTGSTGANDMNKPTSPGTKK
jgi:putative membrane protein